MAKLYLQGYLSEVFEDGMTITEKPRSEYEGYLGWSDYKEISQEIENFAEENGVKVDLNEGLGVTKSIIPDATIRIYFTEQKSTLEEAQESLIAELFGRLDMEVANTGYSEYTITGYYIDEFKIGGHDLNDTLNSHIGEYVHFILEADE